jgi:hypothetical protein
VVVVGTGLFGAALGSWRAALQALFTAVKLPLILLLTAVSQRNIKNQDGISESWRPAHGA